MKVGIKETDELFAAAIAWKEAFKAAKADGEINMGDAPLLATVAVPTFTGLSGGAKIPEELADLDEEEEQYLATKYGAAINDPAIWQIVRGLVIATSGALKAAGVGEAQ